MNTDRPTRDCQHVRARHVHGTVAAYLRDRCRCTPCTRAAARDKKTRELQRLRGTHNPLVPPDRAAAHMRTLMDQWGVGVIAIMGRASVENSHGGKILDGSVKQITRRMEAAILRVRFEDLDGRNRMSARGVRRRLQALACLGWTCEDIVPYAGLSLGTLLRIRGGKAQHCSIAAHRAVAAAYEELWDRPAPDKTPGIARARVRTRARAAAEGWVPPAGWDDIDLDEAPAVADDGVVSIKARRRQDAIDLIAGGVAPTLVADRLGMSVKNLQRILTNAGRGDLAAEVAHAHQVWKDAA